MIFYRAYHEEDENSTHCPEHKRNSGLENETGTNKSLITFSIFVTKQSHKRKEATEKEIAVEKAEKELHIGFFIVQILNMTQRSLGFKRSFIIRQEQSDRKGNERRVKI